MADNLHYISSPPDSDLHFQEEQLHRKRGQLQARDMAGWGKHLTGKCDLAGLGSMTPA